MRFITVRLKTLYPLFVFLGIGLCLLSVLLLTVPSSASRLEDAFAASAEAAVPMTVVIDAGHGGEDCGAVGANGVYEKDLNLSVATALAEELRTRGYTVILTRTEDRLLYSEEENIRGMRKIYDLRNRCAIADAHPQALFISVHMNSFGDARYDGLQVYYAPNREDSRMLADAIQTAVVRDVQMQNRRRIKCGTDLYLLEHATPTAVLVECGFISNGSECERLCDAAYQKTLAQAIAEGIAAYRAADIP